MKILWLVLALLAALCAWCLTLTVAADCFLFTALVVVLAIMIEGI